MTSRYNEVYQEWQADPDGILGSCRRGDRLDQALG